MIPSEIYSETCRSSCLDFSSSPGNLPEISFEIVLILSFGMSLETLFFLCFPEEIPEKNEFQKEL